MNLIWIKERCLLIHRCIIQTIALWQGFWWIWIENNTLWIGNRSELNWTELSVVTKDLHLYHSHHSPIRILSNPVHVNAKPNPILHPNYRKSILHCLSLLYPTSKMSQVWTDRVLMCFKKFRISQLEEKSEFTTNGQLL